ncbi:hypothetical protein EB241_13685 [Erwinia psidii]|uniref:Uncharacterized protein n=1 Tax=Erwinia psidii TaxID=69224 RepID=A0A3N6TQR3_9GAMM|nr:hypothetical protein EB241_13685 [Erwinia psidii]
MAICDVGNITAQAVVPYQDDLWRDINIKAGVYFAVLKRNAGLSAMVQSDWGAPCDGACLMP